MQRTFIQQTIRAVLLMVIALGSLAFPFGDVVLWAVLGAVLATDGPHRPFIGLMALTVFTELIGGLGIGALSLPFAVTALAIAVGGRFLMLAPWPPAERWHLVAAVRAWVVASGSGILMAVTAALMTVLVYDYAIGTAMSAVTRSELLVGIVFTTALALVVMRRMDIPFRIRTQFGS